MECDFGPGVGKAWGQPPPENEGALGEARVHGSLGIEVGQHLLLAEASEKGRGSQPCGDRGRVLSSALAGIGSRWPRHPMRTLRPRGPSGAGPRCGGGKGARPQAQLISPRSHLSPPLQVVPENVRGTC